MWNMFKNNNKDTRMTPIDVVLLSLLSNLNIFQILFWCSHLEFEQAIAPFFSPLNRENIYIIYLHQIFPQLGEIYFGGLTGGKILQKPIFKMADTNLKKNCSILLYVTISELDTLISFYMCGEVLHLLEILTKKNFIMSFLLISKKNNNLLMLLVN